MSETQLAPPREKRAYTPRQTLKERQADKREALLDSIPDQLTPEMRARAARQAKRSQEQAPSEEMVWCKITRRGDGKISTGFHVSGVGEVYHERGDVLQLPIGTFDAYADHGEQTDKGWVEDTDPPAEDLSADG